MAERPINVGSTRQLFLDDYVVDRTDNVVRQLHRPVKHSENPVVQVDRDWEIPGGLAYLIGGTVIYDEEQGRYRMWYRITDKLTEMDGPRASRAPGGFKASYALSDDGVHWEKPVLGLSEIGGSKENNVLPPGTGGTSHIRRPNLVVDYEEPDPRRRHKMVYMDNFDGRWALVKAYSEDGIRWDMGVGEPKFFAEGVFPNGIVFGWDPKREEYVHYHRVGIPTRADVDGRMIRYKQVALRTTSKDFDHWGDPQETLTGMDHDPVGWHRTEGDLAGILYTDDLYVGLMEISSSHHVEEGPPDKYETVFGNYYTDFRAELLVSRNGTTWSRVAPNWEFIPRGLTSDWDDDHIYPAKPIVTDDKILFYYTASNLPTGVHHPEHPKFPLLTTMSNGLRYGMAIGHATMRLDGFVSMDGYDEVGTLTTKPLVFAGDRLVVNVRAPEVPFGGTDSGSPHGSFRVEVLGENGEAIEGYGVGDCDSFTGDELRHVVTWRGSQDLSRLEARAIRLRFHHRNAALYSFQFRGEQEPRPPANLLSPGARGRA